MSQIFNIADMVSARARLFPDKIGARDLDRQLSWRQWNERACRLANGLLGLGLKKGDRVVALAANCVEWAEMYVAAAKAGLILVPINFRLLGEEALYILQDSGAAAVIVADDLTDTIETVRERIEFAEDRFVVFGAELPPAGYRAYEELIARAAAIEPEAVVAPDDPWALMYTSGTTGHPKGAIRSHRDMAMLALMTEVELGLHQHDDALLVMPMHHANSFNFFSAFIYCGGSVTIFSRRSFDAELCLDTLAEAGSTFTSLVPTQYIMMLDVPSVARGSQRFDRVEKLMISSAPARADTKREVMEVFPNSGLFELYGSTEAGWVTMLQPHEQFDKLGTVGREVVGSKPIRMLDETGAEVADGELGELYSCGPYSFQGYWRNPEKTAEAFVGDYCTVGDIAFRDAEGYISIVDRKKNVIMSGGENIYPSEVESTLAGHESVKDVAVVGMPDAKWGERVHAAIVLREGVQLSEDELMAWARGRLAGYKSPRAITFFDDQDMPRNATGKILHRVLRDRIADKDS